MKKLLAKLALFTFTSIVLAMPLQAFADKCITDEEKKNFIITTVEEPFGSAENYPDKKAIVKGAEQTVFKVKDCCRKIIYTTAEGKVTTDDSFEAGECKACTAITKSGDPEKITGGEICDTVMVLFSKGGTTLIEGYISTLYVWTASIVGLISTTVIILSGIQIAVSGGDTQALDSAKSRIIKSISGLAVLFLSGLILYTINPNFFTK